ncbi:MAG: hypothetical protein NZ108_03910, partial [Bacteroidia bacterium]|nr:hypothetical protein [Bacteroidia bacterium]
KKSELEKVLSIFDVAMVRYLEFDESEYPVSHTSLLRKLYAIARSEDARKDMEMEETFLNDFRIQEETIEELQEKIQEEKKRAEEAKQKERDRTIQITELLRQSGKTNNEIESILGISIHDYTG